MRAAQVTTWRRYTAAEKKAYRARLRRRSMGAWASRRDLIDHLAKIFGLPAAVLSEKPHHFADNLGSRVPTMRPKGEVL